MSFEDLHCRDLHIYIAHDADVLHMHWKGTAHIEDPGVELAPYLARLRDEIVRLGETRVIVDISGLDLMNSSCLRVFLAFLKKNAEAPEAERFKSVIRYDRMITWQQAQIPMLATLHPTLIEVEAR